MKVSTTFKMRTIFLAFLLFAVILPSLGQTNKKPKVPRCPKMIHGCKNQDGEEIGGVCVKYGRNSSGHCVTRQNSTELVHYCQEYFAVSVDHRATKFKC